MYVLIMPTDVVFRLGAAFTLRIIITFPTAAIVTLSPVLAFITCLVLLLHMVSSVR